MFWAARTLRSAFTLATSTSTPGRAGASRRSLHAKGRSDTARGALRKPDWHRDFLFGLSSLFCRHAVESFYSTDMDSDSDSSRDATDSRLPAKLLLFGGETVNP